MTLDPSPRVMRPETSMTVTSPTWRVFSFALMKVSVSLFRIPSSSNTAVFGFGEGLSGYHSQALNPPGHRWFFPDNESVEEPDRLRQAFLGRQQAILVLNREDVIVA